MKTATLTSKGQLSLPAAVRRRLGVRAGDRLTFVEDSAGGFRIVAQHKSGEIGEISGFLHSHARSKPVSLKEMDNAIAAEESGTAGQAARGVPRRRRAP